MDAKLLWMALTESQFQILLLITYSAIALISMAIAVYAISVSYLGRETSRSVWRIRKRQEELRKKLKKLVYQERLEERSIEKELRTSKEKEKEINDRLRCLSLKGAVWYPCTFFSIALLIAVSGILVVDGLSSEYFIVSAAVFIFIGFYRLARTLTAIEWVAERIPLPKFKVSFRYGATTVKFKTKKKVEVNICVHNIGDDMAEKIEVFVMFPPDFDVQETPKYNVSVQEPDSDHPNYIAAIFEVETIHVDTVHHFPPVLLKMPKKAGSYAIPIYVSERKVGESKHQLAIEVAS